MAMKITFALCDELSTDKHGLLIKEIEIIFYPSSLPLRKKQVGLNECLMPK